MNQKYDGLFSISEAKRITQLESGGTQVQTVTQRNEFDLMNHNCYDSKGKLVEEADQQTYNSEFLIRIGRLYILEVDPFLSWHFYRTKSRKQFLDFLEFGICNSKSIATGIKAKTKAWAAEKRDDLNWKINPADPIKSFNQYCEAIHSFLRAIHINGTINLKRRCANFNKNNEVNRLRFQAKSEIEAIFVNKGHKDQSIKLINDKFNELSEYYDVVNEDNNMNHANVIPKYIAFFYAIQDPLWGFHAWFKLLIEEYCIIDGKVQVNEPFSKKTVKKQVVSKLKFEDFFIDSIDITIIQSIKEKYELLNSGKSIAILTYLLNQDLKLIEIIPNSKTKSRKHFVLALLNTELKMQGVNKYFETGKDTINISEQDTELLLIKQTLSSIIK